MDSKEIRKKLNLQIKKLDFQKEKSDITFEEFIDTIYYEPKVSWENEELSEEELEDE